MDPQVGQLIANKYRLERLIGDGGMGSVYEATHELLGTTVALKFLHGVLARRKGLKDRFMQEAQVSARIKSIHVVNVSDVDETSDGLAYMVMEYVEGQTLQTLYEENYRARKQLSYAEAFDIMLQILDGVSAAHDLGIVHRDLKPDNVMLTSDTRGNALVKVLDFGIAKLKASGEMDRGLTRPGVVMGTPEYMAPEQAFSADRVDARADIFSLGVMFFEMRAGRRPVGGDNAHAIAAQYLEGQISQLTDLAPSVDAALATAVHKAMGSKPDERFDSVDAFRDAIEPFSPGGAGAVGKTPAFAATLQAEDRTSAVPKTIPPEETFTPPSPADESGPHPVGDTPDDAAMAALAATADDPLRDGTVPMPEGMAASGANQSGQASNELRAGTEAMSPVGPGGSTMVGEAFTPPPVPADRSGGFEAHAPAPAPAPAPMAPPGRGRAGKKKGAGLFSILLIASAVAAATVGGVYVFNETRSSTEGEDDHVPIDIGSDDGGDVDTPDPEPPTPEPTTTDTFEPPRPEPPPPTTPPPRPTQPPPKPTNTTPPPKPTNTTPPPKPTQPPPIIPTVIPSVLPTIPFPIPGQPPRPTQPTTSPPPQPTGLPFPKVQRKRGG